MTMTRHRLNAPLPQLDPDRSEVVLEPEASEPGYWAGCPGVLHEPGRGRFLLTYRQRRPRGHESERGWRCAIAESTDGKTFTDIWAVEKDQLGASSMERFSLLPTPDGRYQLYISYVDPADSRWRIDVLEADAADGFDVDKAKPALTAASTGTEGVKDPYVFRIGPTVYLYASYAEAQDFDEAGARTAHATGDIYNVGVTTCPTGLATSIDGSTYTWHGKVLGVGDEWDRYQSRLNSIVPLDGMYLGFYDGSASHEENYEERCGLVTSHDLVTWRKLTPRSPWVIASSATGSVRYVDALTIGTEWFVYFEVTRADGAHELRLSRLPMA